MFNTKNETIKRIFFSFFLILFFIPFFAFAKYTGQTGRIISAIIFSIFGMYVFYEIMISLKIKLIIAIIFSICVPIFFFFPTENFISIIKYNDNDLSTLVKRAITSWEWWLLSIFISFFPLLFQRDRKLKINYLTHQMLIISIFILIPVFTKLIWVYNVKSIKVLAFLILINIISDTGGYFGGKFFGNKWFNGKKLAPRISPQKTYAGFFIGTILALIFAILYGYFTDIWKDFDNNKFFLSIIFSIILTLVSPLGDLYFSLIKRIVKIKNFSNIIPGHGGFMDRLDGLSFVIITFGIFMLFDFN